MSDQTKVEELAACCVAGAEAGADAGLALVRRLWSMGVEPTITGLVALAVPSLQIGSLAFDCLADALQDAHDLRMLDQELERVAA